MSWVIYFVQAGDGPVKIGRTSDLHTRLGHLRAGNPQELTLLCSVKGDPRMEYYFHNMFMDERLNGEWFKPTPRVLSMAADIAKRGEAAIPDRYRTTDYPPTASRELLLEDIANLRRLAGLTPTNRPVEMIGVDEFYELFAHACGNIRGPEDTNFILLIMNRFVEPFIKGANKLDPRKTRNDGNG